MAIKNLITSDPYYQNLVNPRGFPTGNDVYVPPTTPTPTPEEGIMNIINSNLAQKIYQYNNEGDNDAAGPEKSAEIAFFAIASAGILPPFDCIMLNLPLNPCAFNDFVNLVIYPAITG